MTEASENYNHEKRCDGCIDPAVDICSQIIKGECSVYFLGEDSVSGELTVEEHESTDSVDCLEPTVQPNKYILGATKVNTSSEYL